MFEDRHMMAADGLTVCDSAHSPCVVARTGKRMMLLHVRNLRFSVPELSCRSGIQVAYLCGDSSLGASLGSPAAGIKHGEAAAPHSLPTTKGILRTRRLRVSDTREFERILAKA
jgi:hypothetical protein